VPQPYISPTIRSASCSVLCILTTTQAIDSTLPIRQCFFLSTFCPRLRNQHRLSAYSPIRSSQDPTLRLCGALIYKRKRKRTFILPFMGHTNFFLFVQRIESMMIEKLQAVAPPKPPGSLITEKYGRDTRNKRNKGQRNIKQPHTLKTFKKGGGGWNTFTL
jgi:hypothetical protein